MEGARLGRNGSATREGLHLPPQEQGQIGRGDRERSEAIPQTVRETLREERTGGAAVVGFAATVTSHSEAGRGYGRGSRPVKPRSAKSAERLTAALRSGALTGRAHARKPPAMFGMSLSAPAGASGFLAKFRS